MKAIVIGAGVAGLSSACRLAADGFEVKVLERNAFVGGKLSTFSLGEYRFDRGPSLFTLPHLLEETFSYCGKRLEDYFSYVTESTGCHYFWKDGTQLQAATNPEEFAKQAEDLFGVPAEQVAQYLQKSQWKYDLTKNVFVENSLHRWSTYKQKGVASAALQSFKLNPFTSLNSLNRRKLKHPKLVQLFDRYATYNGSDPYQTSGVMSMIPSLEFNQGVHFPVKGMQSISDALYHLALDMGVSFHFSEGAEEIEIQEGKAKGVRSTKERYPADVVVSNVDIFYTYTRLLKQPIKKRYDFRSFPSSSAIVFYWGMGKVFPELGLHNIFFSEDYKREFEQIFGDKTWPEDPTIYVHISSKVVKQDAPEGKENWFVMVNLPAQEGEEVLLPEKQKAMKQLVLKRLSEALNVEVASYIEEEEIMNPQKIEQKTGSFMGALYGGNSNSWQSAFLRHPNHTYIKGLYCAGGTVHPGGGIPLCLNSAKITVNMIKDDITIEA
ncbi:1-hydroxycarotenoid 3,4-desaturase CrtD [Algivirga pacifica]|uniref:Phytoene desaturase family protein n=1 Tax=Algivirga pacifica TaxID=1162670 RepID=A0ABP9CYE4_9BACT